MDLSSNHPDRLSPRVKESPYKMKYRTSYSAKRREIQGRV